MVIVQGDTTSAYGAALAADALGIPVAHVEAGLRSHDWTQPWPEERNRVMIDRLACLLFAPTAEAAANLGDESPAVRGRVLVTGNTGIDALLMTRATLGPAPPRDGPALILLTCHRRENFGAGIAAICDAALRLAARGDTLLLCPVHSNPAVGEVIRARLSAHPAIVLTGPLPYRETVAAMATAHLILTDSGGIQEEAPALGTPTLVLRDVTERPEALATGNLALVGTDPDRIVAAAARLLDDPCRACRDGASRLPVRSRRRGDEDPRCHRTIFLVGRARRSSIAFGAALDQGRRPIRSTPMAANWAPESWRGYEARQLPDYPDPEALAAAETTIARFPPLVFAGEARALTADLATGRGGQGVPAPGRRLRRELRRIPSQQHPRHLPRAAADGGGADLCVEAAGGEARPHGGPVRQAALDADGGDRRRLATQLPRRQRQRHRLHRGEPQTRSRADDPRLQPVRRHAQPAARLRLGRLCQSATGPPLDARLHGPQPVGGPLPGCCRPDRRCARLHGGLRARSRDRAAVAGHAFLYQPRGAAAPL